MIFSLFYIFVVVIIWNIPGKKILHSLKSASVTTYLVKRGW